MINLPADFVQRMKKLMGDKEFSDFLKVYEKERTYGLRYNPLKFSGREEFEKKAPFALEPVSWCETGYYYRPEEQPGKHPWHEAGAYYIQEPSAMSSVEILDVKPGELVCDLCAAPGGKTTQIAGKLQGEGMLVANEFISGRAKILSRNIERMGIGNAVVLNESTANMARKFLFFFDKILVDAPCSGEGMFRKEPEALTHWSFENVSLCANRQQEILEDAADMLKPGGVLVYSTCTFSPEENEACIAMFLSHHDEFEAEEWKMPDFAPGRAEWAGSCQNKEELKKAHRLWPHLLRGEGHFAVRLRKKENAEGNFRKKKWVKSNAKTSDLKSFYEFEKQNLRGQEFEKCREKCKGEFVLFGEQLYLVPGNMLSLDGLKIERAGLHLGTNKKNRFEPSHALALFLKKEDVLQVKETDAKEISKYLHGEMLEASFDRGWVLICTDGLSIGWGKAQNGVLKNHYPKGLRI